MLQDPNATVSPPDVSSAIAADAPVSSPLSIHPTASRPTAAGPRLAPLPPFAVLALVVVLALLAPGAPAAAAAEGGRATGPSVDAIQAFAGVRNVVEGNRTTEFGAILEFASEDTVGLFGQEVPVVPVAGALVTPDGAFYAWYGLHLPFTLSERWRLTAQGGAGAYYEGNGRDLGSAILFRSALELSYELGDGDRLGAAFLHTSNAGAGRTNPGQESFIFTWTTALGGD